MMQWLKNLFGKVWRRSVPAPVAEVKPKVSRKDDIEAIEGAGKYYYFRDLLENIDTYYAAIKKLRSADPEAFAAYSALGGHIFNAKTGLFDFSGQVDSRFVDTQNRPAFGYVSLGLESYGEENKSFYPSAVFFQKMRYVPDVEIGNGDIYRVGFLWRDRQGKTQLTYFCVQVLPTGEVSPLRQKMRAGKHGWRWGLPTLFQALIDDNPDSPVRKTPKQIGAAIFTSAFNSWASAQTDVQVNIRRDGLAAVFCVDLLRTPYFFKDRDCEVDDNGKRRKIFHIVRTHQRTLRNGSKQWVKSHFRGMRRFMWKGFDVLIVMPGKHGDSLEEFTEHGFDNLDPVVRNGKTVSFAHAARHLSRARWAA